MDRYREQAQEILNTVNQVIYGKEELTEKILTAMLAGGHVLLEDVPGVGKTTLALAFSKAMGLSWRRVQFTPDVMPSDLTGFSIYRKDQEAFVYQPGAVFCNLLLADEINRTSPKTQSALLEVMEERQVTVDGVSRQVPRPFLVIATQNPYGAAGTYALPAAQADRFMACLSMGYPEFEDEVRLAMGKEEPRRQQIPAVCSGEDFLHMQGESQEVFIHERICDYIVSLVSATRNHEALSLGASPRGTIALARMAKAAAWIQGEEFVTPEQVQELFVDVMRHRIVPKSRYSVGERGKEEILRGILEKVPAPLERRGPGRQGR